MTCAALWDGHEYTGSGETGELAAADLFSQILEAEGATALELRGVTVSVGGAAYCCCVDGEDVVTVDTVGT